jgi:hypothetical protein
MTHHRPKLTPLPLPSSERTGVRLRLVAVEGYTRRETGTQFVTLTLRLTGTDHVVLRRMVLRPQAQWVHREAHAALTSKNHKMPSSYDLDGCIDHFNLFIGRTCLGDLRVDDRFKTWDVRRLYPNRRT